MEVNWKEINCKQFNKQRVDGQNGKILKRRKHKQSKRLQKLCCGRPHTETLSINWQKPKFSHWARSPCGIGLDPRTQFKNRIIKKAEIKMEIQSFKKQSL